MQYNLNDVKEKIKRYTDVNKYIKTNSCPTEFENLENLTENIKGGIKNACKTYGLSYANSFDELINHVECAILSSRNWFNQDGLNFTSIRDVLKIDVQTEEKFTKDFKLQYIIKGPKQDRINNMIELVGLAQPGLIHTGLLGMGKWSYLKNMTIGKINIDNNSDAYKTNMDINAICSKPSIRKSFKEENTLLACVHYHSFIEKGEEYSPILEKFELILVVVK